MSDEVRLHGRPEHAPGCYVMYFYCKYINPQHPSSNTNHGVYMVEADQVETRTAAIRQQRECGWILPRRRDGDLSALRQSAQSCTFGAQAVTNLPALIKRVEEALSIIEANECPHHPHQLATQRFRRLFNELAAIERETLERAAKVADKHVQRARDAVAECRDWSPAQAEWSRARDLGLDIADELRSLAAQPEQEERGEG